MEGCDACYQGHNPLNTFKACEISSPTKNFLVIKKKGGGDEKAKAETAQPNFSLGLCASPVFATAAASVRAAEGSRGGNRNSSPLRHAALTSRSDTGNTAIMSGSSSSAPDFPVLSLSHLPGVHFSGGLAGFNKSRQEGMPGFVPSS